ncbi:glycosyltransferase family 2 protein [Roseivirga misakiensis]|uniref:Glycosyltransferase 2-like domain-containing protein n=1 Tax=Roseivirga misakiensis TaxID=1563681 RepID=A0A1E5T5V2_9BACT|nr:glycosyltransferase family 2 protein [Roseivirga misakiensis]OEK06761.1 hypothetical protein BFP71_03620 [Roseivirga misakiensis]
MDPSVAIIIVNWNSVDVTRPCLASLRGLDYPAYKVIVVDNGSTDDSDKILESEFEEVVFLRNQENLGFTGGNNRGITYALEENFDFTMLLNNDTIVTPPFLSRLITAFGKDSSLGAVQPKILYNQERDVIWNAGGIFNKVWAITRTRGQGEKDMGQYDEAGATPWVTGCCFLVKSSIIKQIGSLDDRFFIYYEDTDWSFRITKAGYSLGYEPSAQIYHEVGMSNNNRKNYGEGTLSPFTHYVTVRNHIYMIRKHQKGIYLVTAWLFQAYKVFVRLVYFFVSRKPKKFQATLRGLREGIKN